MTTMGEAATALDRDLFCPWCDYNLRGIDSVRCPECGREVDRANLAISRIPWEHRRQIGRVRAYWRTCWMLLRHPVRFGQAIACPVSYRDAQRFRWATILIWLAVAGMVIALDPAMGFIGKDAHGLGYWPDQTPAFQNLFVPVMAGLSRGSLFLSVAVLIFLASAVGPLLHCRRSMPRMVRDRAVALSRYECALSLIVLLALLVLWACVRTHAAPRWLGNATNWALVVGFVSVGIWWLWTLLVARTTLRCTAMRSLFNAGAWAAEICLILAYAIWVPTWLIGFTRLVVASLR